MDKPEEKPKAPGSLKPPHPPPKKPGSLPKGPVPPRGGMQMPGMTPMGGMHAAQMNRGMTPMGVAMATPPPPAMQAALAPRDAPALRTSRDR